MDYEYNVSYDILNTDGSVRNHVHTIFTMDDRIKFEDELKAAGDKSGVANYVWTPSEGYFVIPEEEVQSASTLTLPDKRPHFYEGKHVVILDTENNKEVAGIVQEVYATIKLDDSDREITNYPVCGMSTEVDVQAFLALAKQAYGWSVFSNGDIAGLVAGDMGYDGCGISIGHLLSVATAQAVSLDLADVEEKIDRLEIIDSKLASLMQFVEELLSPEPTPPVIEVDRRYDSVELGNVGFVDNDRSGFVLTFESNDAESLVNFHAVVKEQIERGHIRISTNRTTLKAD